jgi:hypothetical protein
VPARFPKAPIPDLKDDEHDAVAYAYLHADIPYKHEFTADETLDFTNAARVPTKVWAFGLQPREYRNGVRSQVDVLFHDGKTFAVDLSKETRPYQVILACIPEQATLRAALDCFMRKTASVPPREMHHDARLLVPEMHWWVEHRFRELEQIRILNPRLPPGAKLALAAQFIELKMDFRGTSVASGAVVGADWNGHPPKNDEHFVFDRPYLVVLKNRTSPHPFFVMWVANAELMQRQ